MTFSRYYAHTDPLFKDREILITNRLIINRILKINNEICNYITRTIGMLYISHESQTFSSVGAKI